MDIELARKILEEQLNNTITDISKFDGPHTFPEDGSQYFDMTVSFVDAPTVYQEYRVYSDDVVYPIMP